MFATTEIRWFLRGDIPAEVLQWFHGRDAKCLDQPARTDHYLALPGNALGIKLREGMLEHKQKGGGDEKPWESRACSGTVGHWQKWSFIVEDQQAFREMLETCPLCWKGVVKKRSLHLLKADASGELKFIDYEEAGNDACGWELAEVQVAGSPQKWWTTGFEAFGEKGGQEKTLAVTLDDLITEGLGKYLHDKNSLSYPEWIKSL
jgi:hypothetical protein